MTHGAMMNDPEPAGSVFGSCSSAPPASSSYETPFFLIEIDRRDAPAPGETVTEAKSFSIVMLSGMGGWVQAVLCPPARSSGAGRPDQIGIPTQSGLIGAHQGTFEIGDINDRCVSSGR